MQTGVVKWFSAIKGYGFIELSDKSEDIFLHISSLEKVGLEDIKQGQKVSFNTKSYNGKVSAIDIKLIS